MILSDSAVEKSQSHWAIQSIGDERLKRANQLIHKWLAQCAVSGRTEFAPVWKEEDRRLLEQTAFAYETAAVEGLAELSRPAGGDQPLRDQAISASSKAFEFRRFLPLPSEPHQRMFSILKIFALAWCGDRWSDARRWSQGIGGDLKIPETGAASWEQRLLHCLFNCWVCLFQKDGWEDLDSVCKSIVKLRGEQRVAEEQYLNQTPPEQKKAAAWQLVALYHWAKSTEILALYMLQGEPADPLVDIDQHFEAGIKAATDAGDIRQDLMLHWLHAAGRIMAANSLWQAARSVNPLTSKFVRSMASRDHRAMFELLPPQRAALLEQGLLDQAKTAIVVDLPTSGGKTLLAQFRILQALNQFREDKGWVAYIAPTRALSAQITRRLRKDFEPIDIRVEQLSSAVEVDAFEEDLLDDDERPVDVLIATPEKLSLLVRNKKVQRPLALAVMDEAHNIEVKDRGLRIELLLAIIRQDYPETHFLLLTPDVKNGKEIAEWLAGDADTGWSISLGTTPWKPNERIVGLFRAEADDSKAADWRLCYETLLTPAKRTVPIQAVYRFPKIRPIDVPKSKVLNTKGQTGFNLQTAAIGALMWKHGTSIAVGSAIREVWTMASKAAESLPDLDIPEEVRLVQNFLRAEMGPDFQLIHTLEKGVGVHHAGLPDDVRTLMEWLAENKNLRMLCATSTIAQGINFPVSSVFLASRFVYQGGKRTEIAPREFWNLVGRAGRINHDSVGVVGVCEGNNRVQTIRFVSRKAGALASRLTALLNELVRAGKFADLSKVFQEEQWDDFRCYIAHLWAEKKNLDQISKDPEYLLHQTYGFHSLRNDPERQNKADALLKVIRTYVNELADTPWAPTLSNETGFSPEGVKGALRKLRELGMTQTSDWTPENLFDSSSDKMNNLFSAMLKAPQLERQFRSAAKRGLTQADLAGMTCDWVNGKNLNEISKEYFFKEYSRNKTHALSEACRTIYRAIVNSGTWGVSALSRISGSDSLSDEEQRGINTLPGMIYHGVRTEEAVLMRINGAPRSIAVDLGELYRQRYSEEASRYSVRRARDFLRDLSDSDWEQVCLSRKELSGSDYKRIWEILSGEPTPA